MEVSLRKAGKLIMLREEDLCLSWEGEKDGCNWGKEWENSVSARTLCKLLSGQVKKFRKTQNPLGY